MNDSHYFHPLFFRREFIYDLLEKILNLIFNLLVCPTGHLLNPDNSNLCEECPVGSWNNLTEQTSCTNCVDGQTTLNRGTISGDNCRKAINHTHKTYLDKMSMTSCLIMSFYFFLNSSLSCWTLPKSWQQRPLREMSYRVLEQSHWPDFV